MTSSLGAPARFKTRRVPERKTLGPEVIGIMSMLDNWEPMPWQKEVCDVAFELDENGELVYSEVILIVPRQAGKTSLLLAVQVHRALLMGDHLIKPRPQYSLFTAQSGQDARYKFLNEHLPILKLSPFRESFTPSLRAGNEGIKWNNKSFHNGCVAPNRKSGHGKSLDLVQIDEAFAVEGSILEDGFKPTLATRESSQTWIVSAAGDSDSLYLIKKRDLGREMVKNDVTTGTCYFEWSISDDQDSSDPAVWSQVHPGIGFNIRLKNLEDHFQTMDREAFERHYLARWPGSQPVHVLPPEDWEACTDEESVPEDPKSFCVDMHPDSRTCHIGVAARRSDGLVHVQTIKKFKGTSGVVGYIEYLLGRHKGSDVGMDSKSPVTSLLADLKALGVEPRLLNMQDVARATGDFYNMVVNHELRHLGQNDPTLELSRLMSKKRPLGEGWAWDRKGKQDVSGLNACTLAAHLLKTREKTPTWDFDIL